MELLRKSKVEEAISAAERIVSAQNVNKRAMLFEISEEADKSISKLTGLLDSSVLQDPDKSYHYFYDGIQKLLLSVIPANNEIRPVILELKTILLTGKEKQYISYGKRGADSRGAKTSQMEYVIDILTEWSNTPHEFYKLALLLLSKNKSLGYCPEEREFSDFMKKH